MSLMNIQKVLTLLTPDETLLADDPTEYDSFTVPEDLVVKILFEEYDEWCSLVYVQVIKDNGMDIVCCHVENSTYGAISLKFGTKVDIKVFKELSK